MAKKKIKKYWLRFEDGEWRLRDNYSGEEITIRIPADQSSVLDYLEQQGMPRKEIIYTKPDKPENEKDSSAGKGLIEESPLF
jgi:hypothetical protein